MLTPEDHNLLKRETSLKELRSLIDRDCFGPLIENAATEVDASNATLTYLRYKPGVNCLAGYTYESGGETRYVYTKIFSDNQAEKRAKFLALSGSENVQGLSYAFFPNDGKLRSLKKIDGGTREQQFVARVFSDREDLWAGKIQAIRYKPERRYVARLMLDGQNVSVLKMHSGGSYARLRNLNKSFKSRENLQLARRIGHSDRHRVLAFEWLPGQLLSDDLRAGIFLPETLTSVGKALAHLHEQKSDHLPANSPQAQAEQILAVSEQVSFILPALAPQLEKVAGRIASLLIERPWNYSSVHGDFYAKQILINGEFVGVLDFDESAYDDPMSDIGNFMAHLERDCLRFNLHERHIEDAENALVEGYARAGLPHDSRRIALFTSVNLFKLLPHPFRFREPCWPEQTHALLQRIENILAKSGNQTAVYQPMRHLQDAPPATYGVEDHALPFLKDALDHNAALPVLAEALKESFPDARIDSISRIQLRRHKLGRRSLIEYAIPLHAIPGKSTMLQVMGKSRRKKVDTATLDVVSSMWQNAFHSSAADGVFVPEPLGKVPAFNMWLQRKVDGYTASNYLQGPAGMMMGQGMARALFKLHAEGPVVERSHSIDDELLILASRLTELRTLYPAWGHRIDKVIDGCKKVASLLPEVEPQPIHRDFYPDNVLIAANGIYILDLDLYCMGDPALDVGNFIGHVIETSLRQYGDPQSLQSCSQAFEDTYVALAGNQLKRAIAIYTTLTLARHIQISTLFEDRRPFTENLLTLCEERLANHAKLEPIP